jgi:hypothetical protein
MKRCQKCGIENRETANFCEECGTRLAEPPPSPPAFTAEPVSRPVSSSGFKASAVTSVGIPPLVEPNGGPVDLPEEPPSPSSTGVHGTLIIERGGGANSEFPLSGEESQIGRWDADNGIFPDVDLDAFDSDAKVSRRHARVTFRNGAHMIEDLGSTNGTFVNRGRRLLPGSPQVLNDGDEIIVGKTFLRFRVKS